MPRRRWIIAGSAVLLLVVLVAARNLVASDGDGAAAGGPGEGVWLALTGDGSGDFGEGTEHRIRIVNMADGSEREVGEDLAYAGIEWSPDGTRLLAIDVRGGDGCVTLIEPESGDQTEIACGLIPSQQGMWSPDGSRFLLGDPETSVATLFDHDGDALAERELDGRSWQWSPDSTYILVGEENSRALLLSPDDLSVLHEVTLEEVLDVLGQPDLELARLQFMFWLTSNQFLLYSLAEGDEGDPVTVVVGVVRDGEVFLERRMVPEDILTPFEPFADADASALAEAVAPDGSRANVNLRYTADGEHAWAMQWPPGGSAGVQPIAVALGDEVVVIEVEAMIEGLFGTFGTSVVVVE